MKPGAVPTTFPIDQLVELINVSDDYEPNGEIKPNCGNCDILILERDGLKQTLLETNINSDLIEQKKDDVIRKLTSKCDDQSVEIVGLKKAIVSLEKRAKGSDTHISKLRDQVFKCMNVSVCFNS